MHHPGRQKDKASRYYYRCGLSPTAQPEIERLVEKLHHEVFPVNIYPAPEIREAGRKIVKMMRLRQPEAKKVEHADDQVKLARNSKVEKKPGYYELSEVFWRRNFRGRNRPVIIDHPVKDEVNHSPGHPVDAGLINNVGIGVVVIPLESLVVHYRQEREANIRQHKKVRQRLRERLRCLLIAHIVEINHQTKHEHRAQTGPDGR